MPLPKRRSSHAHSSKRWAGYRKAKTPTLVTCPNCQEEMQPHHVCPSCGYYKGKEIIKIEKES